MASFKQKFSVKGRKHTLDTSLDPDFCIKLREDSLSVHKEILTSCSDYFCCLFNSGMQEVQNQTLNLEDLNSKVVKSVVAYIYGADITIRWEEVPDYLDIVECWQLMELKAKMEEYILGNINVHNCISGSLLAQKYQPIDVHDQTNNFLQSNFASMAASPDFLSVDLPTLKGLLTNDMMLNLSCDDKLQACINWILAREADRKCHYKDLLDHTGLTKCSHRFTQLAVRSYMNTVSAEDSLSVETYTSMLLAFTNAPKIDKEKKMVFLGAKEKSILQFDFDNPTIDGIGFLPDIFVGAKLVRCYTPYGMFSHRGSSKLLNTSATCALLDIPSMAYLHLPEPLDDVADASAVFANDNVYVLGGFRTPNVMCRLDMQTLQWSRCANMPQASIAPPIVCSTGTKIYAFLQTGLHFILITYSTTHDLWEVEKDFPQRLCQDIIISAIPVDVHVYILTIRAHIRTCVRYNTVSHEWTDLSEFSARYMQCTGVYMDNKIVVCGIPLTTIDIYDIECNEWKRRPIQMPRQMLRVFAMVL